MALSKSELKAGKSSRQTRSLTICVDQDLVVEVQRLNAEKSELLEASASRREDGERSAPRRVGEESQPARIGEINAELESLYAQMRESEGELVLRATDGGRWLRWKDDHPPRPDNALDENMTYGVCNAADLLEDMGTYLHQWNGEVLEPADWSWLQDKIAAADIAEMARTVVGLHEVRISVPKSSSASSATRANESA